VTLVLALDFETNGTNPGLCDVIEIGAVLWDVERACYLETYGALVEPTGGVFLSAEITRITGIRADDINRFGLSQPEAFGELTRLADCASYLVAHNATSFDRPIFERHVHAATYKWIDTITDLPFPPEKRERKLIAALAEHGFASPFPHRALTDALSCAKLLSLYPFAETVARSEAASVLLIANVSYNDKDSAKSLGFQWQEIRGLREPRLKTWGLVVKRPDVAGVLERINERGALPDGRPRVPFKVFEEVIS